MTAPARPRRIVPVLGSVLGLCAVAGLAWLLHAALGGQPSRVNRSVQTVQLIRPPPPPPEVQPPPPEQPKDEVPIDSPQPKDAADDAAPSEQLGLDTNGTAGGDAFGLAAHKGGRDLAGTGGAAFAWYTGRLKDRVGERLGMDAGLRARKFAVTVKIWIENDGHIHDAQLASSTGDHDLDLRIRSALASVSAMAEPPPLEMPQPISLRIISRI